MPLTTCPASMLDSMVDDQGRTLRVEVRRSDGYVNATVMCQSAGKQWKNYNQNKESKAFLRRSARKLALDISDLVKYNRLRNQDICTWIHLLLCTAIVADVQRWLERNEHNRSKEGYVYAVTSDLLNAVKIGSWSGILDNLQGRYGTMQTRGDDPTPKSKSRLQGSPSQESAWGDRAIAHTRNADLGGERCDTAHFSIQRWSECSANICGGMLQCSKDCGARDDG